MRYTVLLLVVLATGCANELDDVDKMFIALSEGVWDFEGHADSCKYPFSRRFSIDRKKQYWYRHNGYFGSDGRPRDRGESDIISVRPGEIDIDEFDALGAGWEVEPHTLTIVMLTDTSYCQRVNQGECYGRVSRCPHVDHDN